MMWLWLIGPLVVLLGFLVLTFGETNEEKRRKAEVLRWIDELLGPIKRGKKTRSRRVRSLPAALSQAVKQAGGGARITDLVLVPKHAYVAVRSTDTFTASGHQTVVCALAKSAPKFVCRPLPIIDGRPVENRGVHFGKDPEFMDSFVVEGADGRAIGKWLKPSLRKALSELGEVWLRAEGRVMTVTLYGPVTAEQLNALVGVADAFFAAKGAGGRASLFGEMANPKEELAKATNYRSYPKVEVKAKETDSDDELLAPASPPQRLQAGLVDLTLYALAGILVAMVLGRFAQFHPEVLFNNPEPVVNEPWQGGWTTRGVGAFVAVETLLVGLFVWQTYLGAAGSSIGKMLFGLRVVRANDDGKAGFFRGVLLRSWIYGLAPIIAAVIVTRPFAVRTFLTNIPTKVPLLVAGAVACLAGLVVAAAKDGRSVHDFISGTTVVHVEPWRLRRVQLGQKTRLDPAVLWQALPVLALLMGVLVVIALAVKKNWPIAPF